MITLGDSTDKNLVDTRIMVTHYCFGRGSLELLKISRASDSALTPIDPNLTLTHTQCSAIVGNAGNRKPFVYAVSASPCNTQQPLTAHS